MANLQTAKFSTIKCPDYEPTPAQYINFQTFWYRPKFEERTAGTNVGDCVVVVNAGELQVEDFCPVVNDDLQFEELAAEWRMACRWSSSSEEMAEHPAYRRIVGLGPQAIPYILRDLEREPDHWFIALAEITNEDPVPAHDRGRIQAMANAWIEWGKAHRYI